MPFIEPRRGLVKRWILSCVIEGQHGFGGGASKFRRQNSCRPRRNEKNRRGAERPKQNPIMPEGAFGVSVNLAVVRFGQLAVKPRFISRGLFWFHNDVCRRITVSAGFIVGLRKVILA